MNDQVSFTPQVDDDGARCRKFLSWLWGIQRVSDESLLGFVSNFLVDARKSGSNCSVMEEWQALLRRHL